MGAVQPIIGIDQTRNLLARFEPDLLKRLDRRMTAVARKLKARGQANFARTGASGSAYTIRTRKKVDGFVKSVTAASGSVGEGEKWSSQPGVLATIFELMQGPRNAMPQNVPRVESLVATLNARYGETGRFLWQAWDDIGGGLDQEVRAELADVEAEYTRRLAEGA